MQRRGDHTKAVIPMSTITRRDGFVSQLKNRAIDVKTAKNDAQLQQAVQQGGGNPADIAKADLNGDGTIQGAAEANALFSQVDRLDHDGNANTVLAKDAAGRSTAAGQASARLLGLSKAAAPVAASAGNADFGSRLSQGGANALEERTRGHTQAIERSGVGTHFGDHSSFKGYDAAERKQWVESQKTAGSTPPTPRESSCIGWAMENVGAAYYAAGKAERWGEIQRTVVSKGSKGVDLAKELKKDGWEAVYWNPDARNPSDGSSEHSYSAAVVAKGKGYYGVKVDHTVQNYRPTAGGATKLDNSGITALDKVPFFFGMAKGGMHTFVGRKGNVNEFHWNAMPNDKNAIEETPLKDWGWNSGLIMVPPGSWPKD